MALIVVYEKDLQQPHQTIRAQFEDLNLNLKVVKATKLQKRLN